jgi:hypothetical protein
MGRLHRSGSGATPESGRHQIRDAVSIQDRLLVGWQLIDRVRATRVDGPLTGH